MMISLTTKTKKDKEGQTTTKKDKLTQDYVSHALHPSIKTVERTKNIIKFLRNVQGYNKIRINSSIWSHSVELVYFGL